MDLVVEGLTVGGRRDVSRIRYASGGDAVSVEDPGRDGEGDAVDQLGVECGVRRAPMFSFI